MEKRRVMSQNWANWGPCRGSPALGGRLADPLAFYQWGSVNDRPPMAEPLGQTLPGGSFRIFGSSFRPVSFGFLVRLEVPTLYRHDSFAVAKVSLIRSQWVLVSSDLKVV